MKLRFAFSTLLATASSACALTIQLDYSYDSTNFFSQNAAAKAAVDKAAADLGAAITSNLRAVSTDVFTGTNGTTSATFDWGLTFANPSAPGQSITIATPSLPANVFTIYVGMRPLSDATLGTGGNGVLGQGGPIGVTLSHSYSGYESTYAAELPGAVDKAEAASDAVMTRGGGPVMGSLSGSFNPVPNTSFVLHYGALGGTLWFDDDTDNNGLIDSAATMASFWQYDPFSAVAAGKNDLYSVALHEILHSLGIGTADSWDQLVSGTDWLGANAIALNGGTGTNLLSADGDHLRSSLLSTRISDGGTQEAVMDPSLTVGTRKLLTQMDLAFMRDIGYSTVPEPGVGLLTVTGVLLLWRRRARDSAPV